jgi:uncharacterized protein
MKKQTGKQEELMSRMVEVLIDSIRVSLTNQQRIIILKEIHHERYLPIWIGPYEAEAITISLQEVEVSRPQTHDLLKNFLTQLNARLVRVEVVAIRDDVFYANLVIEHNENTIQIDSRTSDAIALAVRAHVPIFVAAEIMENDAIMPEEDLKKEPASDGDTPPTGGPVISEKRLSVFEDFLQNLDLDDKPGPSADEADPEPDDEDPDPTP